MAQRPFLILIVLDGFGCRKEREFNAIAEASKPRFDRLFRESPWTTLEASGNAVGLPAGQMGNSEVGHMNIGAGRIITQDLPRIDDAVADRSIVEAAAFKDLIARSRERRGAVHVMGLLSPGGVHSHQRHIEFLVRSISG